jgi:hypothetical protein
MVASRHDVTLDLFGKALAVTAPDVSKGLSHAQVVAAKTTQPWAPAGVLECRDTGLSVDQGAVQAAARADRRDGRPPAAAGGPLKLLVDSTGIKFLGDGEWHARKHGVQGRHQWRKVHLAMDTATADIRAVELTPQPGR